MTGITAGINVRAADLENESLSYRIGEFNRNSGIVD